MTFLNNIAKAPIIKGLVDAYSNENRVKQRILLLTFRIAKLAVPVITAPALLTVATGPASIGAKILTSCVLLAVAGDVYQLADNGDRRISEITNANLHGLGILTHKTLIIKSIVNTFVYLGNTIEKAIDKTFD